jgi:hypothetical protein
MPVPSKTKVDGSGVACEVVGHIVLLLGCGTGKSDVPVCVHKYIDDTVSAYTGNLVSVRIGPSNNPTRP